MMIMMSGIRRTFFFVLGCVLLAGGASYGGKDVLRFQQDTGTNHAQQIGFKPTHPERGYLENCGPGGGVFNISWYPKDISPTRQIMFFADLVSPVDMDKVRIQVAIMYEGAMIVTFDQIMTCEDINAQVKDVFPKQALHIVCPVRKGQLLKGYYEFTNTERVIGLDGDYALKGRVLDLHGKQLLCFKMHVVILPFQDM